MWGHVRLATAAHEGETGCAILEAAETNDEVAAGLVRWRRLVESVTDDGG